MSYFKTPTKYLAPILIAFVVAVIFIFNVSKRLKLNYNDVEFRAVIIKIEKKYRGRYDLTLRAKSNEVFIVTDNSFYNYRNDIKLGDSLIKLKNFTKFLYTRENKIVIEATESIQL
jgi:hypothetical protein